jgi:hypothetical protein
MHDEFERFMAKVDKGPDCWLWTASLHGGGYGQFHSKHERAAHRWAYLYFVGPIPDGLILDHLCRNRACVNPDHLEAVTNEENLRRGMGYKVVNGLDPRCVRGHAYTPENTYHRPDGSVVCRACARERDKSRPSGWARQRAANDFQPLPLEETA